MNWAVRGIGKRNAVLNAAAVETAHRIQATGTRSGRWIAADARRELQSQAVRRRLSGKQPVWVHRLRGARVSSTRCHAHEVDFTAQLGVPAYTIVIYWTYGDGGSIGELHRL